jgi:hypothetical protein
METKIRALLKYSGMNEAEMDSAIRASKAGGAELAKLYFELGETGRLAMGISEEILVAYGDNTEAVFVRLTESLEDIPEDVKTKYNL